MRLMILTFALCFNLTAPTTALQERSEEELDRREAELDAIRSDLSRTAFNPDLFFEFPQRGHVTVRFFGGHERPVWAMAARLLCRDDSRREPGPGACDDSDAVWVFRLSRAPGSEEPDNDRVAAFAFADLMLGKTRSGQTLTTALDSAPSDWLETDLDRCPAAQVAFTDFVEGSWLPTNSFARRDRSDLVVIGGWPDEVEVRFETYTQTLEFSGAPDRSFSEDPIARVLDLHAALAECWEPSEGTTPWRVYEEYREEIEWGED